MNKQPTIVVFGSLNYDYVMWADKLPRLGETVVGKKFGTFIGGKGANQAVQAARLGARTYMIGRIGNDAMGDAVLKSLKDSGVITDFVKRDPVKGTGTASVMVDSEGNNYLMISAEANGTCEKCDIDEALEVIKSADILITQLETTVPLAEYALRVARENNVTTILNPAPAVIVPESIFKLADIVTPNETEAEAHTGIVQTENIEEWCSKVKHKFNAMGAGTVIVTLGKNGAFIGCENEERIIPAYAGINAVDATAAGDSFNAALAVALAEGKDIIEGIKFANGAGAISVSRAGAQASLPTREELEFFLKEHRSH
jgi:ribokinase